MRSRRSGVNRDGGGIGRRPDNPAFTSGALNGGSGGCAAFRVPGGQIAAGGHRGALPARPDVASCPVWPASGVSVHHEASVHDRRLPTLPAVRAAPGRRRRGGGPGGELFDDTPAQRLLDSRNRWRDLVSLTADLAFETDVWGRFVFVSPDPALGWPASTLLGQPAELLLADADGTIGFNPFRPTSAVRRRRAWLKRPDGSGICLAFAAAPLTDAEGRIVGARGIGQDTTEQDGHDRAMAAALRRGEVLDHILWRMRQEVLAPKMMEAALTSLTTALGAEGAAVLDVLGDGSRPGVLYQTGGVAGRRCCTPHSACCRPRAPTRWSRWRRTGARCWSCSSQTRFAEQTGLALWRIPGGRDWDNEERVLASSATGIIRMILDHDSIQREMARQARTDPLTGLLNRRAFMDELARRLDRLDREGLPGTLMFVDLDHFKQLNDVRGHEAGDTALCVVATLLRDTVRPADLVARLGGDEFAIWLDGADDLAAAERAEHLRIAGPRALASLTEGTGVPADPVDRHRHPLALPRRGHRDGAAPRRPGHVPGQAQRSRPLAGRPSGGRMNALAPPRLVSGAGARLAASPADEATRVRLGASTGLLARSAGRAGRRSGGDGARRGGAEYRRAGRRRSHAGPRRRRAGPHAAGAQAGQPGARACRTPSATGCSGTRCWCWPTWSRTKRCACAPPSPTWSRTCRRRRATSSCAWRTTARCR